MGSLKKERGELRERFYQSVAETLTLLHTAPGYDRRLAMSEIVRILSSTIGLPLVWIGRREPDDSNIEVVAAAGPAAEYAQQLHLSADADHPAGQGPLGKLYRQGGARVTSVDSAEFAPWRAAAKRHDFGSTIAAVSSTRDGGQLSLTAYARLGGPALNDELLDWAQRLAEELARFWDHQGLLERNLRMSRYRDAQRTIQRALLDQPDPAAVYHTLAQSLADIAGAAAVDVYAISEDSDELQRVALVGPMADAMRRLSTPPRDSAGAAMFTPGQAFVQGKPVFRIRPASCDNISPIWREGSLAQVGALGCWPVFGAPGGDVETPPVPVAVFAVVTREADAFDVEMCRLFDEIADAAGLALRQHDQRRALFNEQQRQTYLALHDALTGLPNRRALDRHLERVLAKAKRQGHVVALGMLDVDDLKPINDRFGHAMGDHILTQIAARLRGGVRREDYVARLGGDEFVLVFEQLDADHDLDALLAGVGAALKQPLLIDGESFLLSASLGMALFPTHADASGEQLLRHADQAMYQVKAQKRQRARWWSLPALVNSANALPRSVDGVPLSPYGGAAAERLLRAMTAFADRLPQLLENIYAELLLHEGVAGLIAAYPEKEAAAVKRYLVRNVELLFLPELTLERHRVVAMQAGFFYAANGAEEVWLLEVIERVRDVLASALGAGAERDPGPLAIVLQRLGMDRQWQLESMRVLQRRRVAVLAQLNELAWSADSYLDLIQGAVDILSAHDEIVACAVGRPDAAGELTYEAVAGDAFAMYMRALARGEAAPIRITNGSSNGGGPNGRAWRSAAVHRCTNYRTDAAMEDWRDITLSLGIVSNVAIPLCPTPRVPAAILTLYSAYSGGFQSEDQQAFVEQVKSVLDLALSRLAPPRPGAELLPFFVRERWRAMSATTAVQMHYQPVIRLADGRVSELEALARLHDIDGSVLPPVRFLPALGDDELLHLFRQALLQATSFRQTLCGVGYPLDISVNIPAAAVEDSRYVATAAEVLAASGCPPAAVLFEILESPLGSGDAAPLALSSMQALKALGVRLVEDDLGAGYSSLIRLRQWPFDRVKIDQALVLQVADDPLRTLRFIRQLIRLSHDLELEVVVEGLETPGLIEAALILGADLGQGYALARPMPQDQLRGWLAGFQFYPNVDHPMTALGALAAALFWEERLAALPTGPVFWTQHAEASFSLVSYLESGDLVSIELIESHAAMHEASGNGPADRAYRKARGQFLDLLVEHVRAEETCRERAVVAVVAVA